MAQPHVTCPVCNHDKVIANGLTCPLCNGQGYTPCDTVTGWRRAFEFMEIMERADDLLDHLQDHLREFDGQQRQGREKQAEVREVPATGR